MIQCAHDCNSFRKRYDGGDVMMVGDVGHSLLDGGRGCRPVA